MTDYSHHRDREAEARALRRHQYTPARHADADRCSLGDVLDGMVWTSHVESQEPFERRALEMVAILLDVVDSAAAEGSGMPPNIHYSLSNLARGFVEIGRRLEDAGKPRNNVADIADALGPTVAAEAIAEAEAEEALDSKVRAAEDEGTAPTPGEIRDMASALASTRPGGAS